LPRCRSPPLSVSRDPKIETEETTNLFNSKSIYALNKKDQGAIVYIDAEGETQRLTQAEFISEKDFLRWKEWSDEDYHTSEKEGHLYSDHTVSVNDISDETAAVLSPEAQMADEDNRQEQERRYSLLREALNTCLTSTQRRRLWLYCVEGMTIEQIAVAENVRHQNVSKAISSAKKKVKTFFRKQGAKTPFSPR
jgi:RNA polymerase sigma factor (sigma-70 family)